MHAKVELIWLSVKTGENFEEINPFHFWIENIHFK
jgi:hypothetical protein